MRPRDDLLSLRSPRSRVLLLVCMIGAGMVAGLGDRGFEELWDVDRTHASDSSFVETRGFPSGWFVLSTPANAALTTRRFAPIPFARAALAWLAFSTLGLGLAIALNRMARGARVFPPCSPALRLFSVAATWLGSWGLWALEMESSAWKVAPGLAVGLIGPALVSLLPVARPVRRVGWLLTEVVAVALLCLGLADLSRGLSRAATALDFLPSVLLVLSISLGLEALFRIALTPDVAEAPAAGA